MNKFLLIAFVLLGGAAASDPVKVDLYFEGLCEGCHDMILKQLYPTYQKVKEIMDVHLYAYGNAQYWKNANGTYGFMCQHGVAECKINMIISCFQHHSNSSDDNMEFVNCMAGQSNPATSGPMCAGKTSVPWSTVNTCITTSEGEEVLAAVAEKTAALKPPHQFVPWPVVDGTSGEDVANACDDNMLKVVCDKYTGSTKPAACAKVTETVSKSTENIKKEL